MSRNPALLIAAGTFLLAGCETVERTVTEIIGNDFAATLNGANEVPAGDPDGVGTAHISVDDATNRVCTHLEVRNIGPVTAAHIHRGAAGVNGPPVITLDPPDGNSSDDCASVDNELLDAIRRNPSAYYVNVHTSDYPNGAIRGQVYDVKG